MKDASTEDLFEFLGSCIFDGLLVMMWYKNILFRCLPGKTYAESKTVLWVMLAAAILTGACLVFRYRRTELAAMVSVLFPYGLYTVLAYAGTSRTLIVGTLTAAGGVAVLYAVRSLTEKPRRRSHRHYRKNRLYDCWCASMGFMAAGMTVTMLVLGAGKVLGVGNLYSDVDAFGGDTAPSQTINENMSTVLLLQEEEWSRLTVRERLDVMQTVANIEAHYLGLPNELNVTASSLADSVLGCYSDDTHTISICLDQLEYASAHRALEVCCHEAYHSYQYRLVDAYSGADASLRRLRIFKSAATYSRELGDYIDGKRDFEDYYNQDCEADSREYAQSAVLDYYRRIETYLAEQAANPAVK